MRSLILKIFISFGIWSLLPSANLRAEELQPDAIAPGALPADSLQSELPAADVQQSIISAITERSCSPRRIADLCFQNPAAAQWQFSESLTHIEGIYANRADNEAIDPRLGRADYDWQFHADTYLKYKSSTLSGEARYANGSTADMKWNETADATLLYPYLTADSIGGDMHHEIYSFRGAYADHRGRWGWGVALDYTARLEYRTVDPRPRNVSGTLSLRAGATFSPLPRYQIGLGLSWMRYKQSNDIEFKSELGVEKIFHLTGLATHYTRFAGTSLSVNYQGYSYGLDLSIFPSEGKGLFAACNLSRLTFTNILTDLNKLPMASAWENTLSGEIGWLSAPASDAWGAAATISASRRHGTENIFGDPAASIYPQIGSLTMYGRNTFSLGGAAGYTHTFPGAASLSARLSGEYYRNVEAYVQPRKYTLLRGAELNLLISSEIPLPHQWLLSPALKGGAILPSSCQYSPGPIDPSAELAGLQRLEERLFLLNSANSYLCGAKIALSAPLARRFRLSIAAEWEHHAYTLSTYSDQYQIKLSFIF